MDATPCTKGGDNPGDELRVRIPIDAGFGGRAYCPPAEWQALDGSAAAAHWTLAPGGYLLAGRTSCGRPYPPAP